MQRFNPTLKDVGDPYQSIHPKLVAVMALDTNGDWVRASDVDAMREHHHDQYSSLLRERDALEETLRKARAFHQQDVLQAEGDLAAARRTIDTLNGNLVDAQRNVTELEADVRFLRPHSRAWCAICNVLRDVAPGWEQLDGKGMDKAVGAIKALADERDRLRAGYERALQHVAANTPSETRPRNVSIFDIITGTAQQDEAGHAMLADCGNVTINLAPGSTVTMNAPEVTLDGHVHTGVDADATSAADSEQPAPMTFGQALDEVGRRGA